LGIELVKLSSEEEKIHLIVSSIVNFKRFKQLLVLKRASTTPHRSCPFFISKDLITNLLVSFFRVFDQISLLFLNILHLFKGNISLLTALEEELGHMLCLRSEFEDVCVIRGHVWLNMIKKEGLNQMCSVNFQADLLEE